MLSTGITIQNVKPFTNAQGITQTEVHTYDDLGLIMATYYIPEPSVKDSRISIPYASGTVDLTESAGYIPYNDRDGVSFEFLLKNASYEQYHNALQKIANMLHGQKLRIILDSDPAYFYNCRLAIDAKKSDVNFAKITISGTADPFKYDLLASNEPWKWNPFNFTNGVITETLADIIIAGTKSITIPHGGILTAPTFYVYTSSNLKVTFDGVNYSLDRDASTKAYNTFRFPQIKVGDENKTLVFTGNGKISIEYRGRYL